MRAMERSYPWSRIDTAPNKPGPAGTRSASAALVDNPCLSCELTACCWYAKLESLPTRSAFDFDYMRYLLNFADLEIMLQPKANWSLYLRRPCSKMDPESRKCTIRGTQAHPKVCTHYDPHNCWYKRTLSGEQRRHAVRLDHRRLAKVLELVQIDEYGDAASVPSYEQVRNHLGDSYGREGADHSFDDSVPFSSLEDSEPVRIDQSPCQTCPAACCRTVRIAKKTPVSFGEFDYFRYITGFPGVSVAIDERGQWSLIVRTTCRHLDPTHNNCRNYGSPERPRRCEHLDEWRCRARRDLVTSPERLAILPDAEAVGEVIEATTFDAEGKVTSSPRASIVAGRCRLLF